MGWAECLGGHQIVSKDFFFHLPYMSTHVLDEQMSKRGTEKCEAGPLHGLKFEQGHLSAKFFLKAFKLYT